jgi:hypothetical protein
MNMLRATVLLLTLGLGGCANRPARNPIPVDAELTAQVYDVTLAELKRIMTPKAGVEAPINWSERMYLNPVILLPAADSANPLSHDPAWLNSTVTSGLVLGVCGKPPAMPCSTDTPVAFVSLSPPWTLGGDTVYVQGGYSGEVPRETTYEAVFWIFTLAHDEETGELKVVRKGPPNRMTFESH